MATPQMLECRVRHHFVELASNHSADIDVKDTGYVAMEVHGRYKYLVHLGGCWVLGRVAETVATRERAQLGEA